MKVVFFGTPHFAVNILSHLIENKVDVVGVVTKPDKPQGRHLKLKPTPVKQYLIDHNLNIPLFQPGKISTSEWEETLKKLDADLFVVVAFGEILKQNILDIPKLDCVNIHASLLPKYRGAAPIHRAIIDGEQETGVTIMKMVKALDAGDMLHVEKVRITDDMDVSMLESDLERAGCKAILEVISLFDSGKVSYTPQIDSEATYAHKITPEECQIHFHQQSNKIFNLIRGSSPYPGAWCLVQTGSGSKRLKIKRAKVRPDLSGEPGKRLGNLSQEIIVATQDFSIEFLEVQLQGKRSMTVKEFLAGHSKLEFSKSS